LLAGDKLCLDNGNFYASGREGFEHVTGYAAVGDDLIHILDRAYAAETTAAELR
jgi:hypothetical protein